MFNKKEKRKMTLKQFVNKIGGMTDKNMQVVIHRGLMERDYGMLKNIRARVETKHYGYKDVKVEYFNIVENELHIYLKAEA